MATLWVWYDCVQKLSWSETGGQRDACSLLFASRECFSNMTGISMLVFLNEAPCLSFRASPLLRIVFYHALLLPSDGLLKQPLALTGLKTSCCVQLFILSILTFPNLTTNTLFCFLFIIFAGHKSSGRMWLLFVPPCTPTKSVSQPPDLIFIVEDVPPTKLST